MWSMGKVVERATYAVNNVSKNPLHPLTIPLTSCCMQRIDLGKLRVEIEVLGVKIMVLGGDVSRMWCQISPSQ